MSSANRNVVIRDAPVLETECFGGLRARAPLTRCTFVSDRNLAAFDDEAIEGKLAFETTVDIAGDVLVLNQRVWIEGGHDAA